MLSDAVSADVDKVIRSSEIANLINLDGDPLYAELIKNKAKTINHLIGLGRLKRNED